MTLPLAQPGRQVAAKRLLIIVFSPGDTQFEDFLEIAREVSRLSPETAINIVTPRDTWEAIPPARRALPTLTVGIGTDLGRFIPARGAIRAARAIPKLEQFARFRALEIPTPETARFEPGARYDEEKWGEFVVLKPLPLSQTSTGLGLKLIRTRRLGSLSSPAAVHALTGVEGPMLVQSFIDTGDTPAHWRVLMLFGRPLYSMKFRCPIVRPPLSSDDSVIESAIVETKHPDLKKKFGVSELRELTADPRILEFATQIASAYPTIPLQGVDILEDLVTQKLYALEINGGGKVWHFSSPRGELARKVGLTREKRIAQFGAWKAAAEALISQLLAAS
ncbi:hypothetical protein [Aestuariivirga sp.]|uniref:hypothetical protein n=1 Tax=Aestuariivirga sp. TaxID=2650926 RepID=UPI0039E2B610